MERDTMPLPQSWQKVAEPHIKRLEVAAALNANVTYNAKGCAALAFILKRMARIIDDEIDRRRSQHNPRDGRDPP
jgi:hypothetical protein